MQVDEALQKYLSLQIHWYSQIPPSSDGPRLSDNSTVVLQINGSDINSLAVYLKYFIVN